jgi:hypothetical protein
MRSESWDTSQGKQGVVNACGEFLPTSRFCKFGFEETRLAYIVNGILKSPGFADLRTHSLLDIIAQMTFQLVEDLGRVNPAAGQLASPLGDCTVKAKHNSFY